MFHLEPRDPLREKKAKFWRMDGPEQRRIRLCVSDNDATRTALSILRIIVADGAEMAVVEGELLLAGRVLVLVALKFLMRAPQCPTY